MNNKNIKNVMGFYLLATKLKQKIRSGWDNTHWNINADRIESVAEHVYGCCILAIAIDSEYEFNIDLNKVLKMLILHEIGEVLIGDITPFDNVSKEEKEQIEHEAMEKILGNLIKKEEILNLLIEFDSHKTKESIFAHYCDKLEADIQSKVYQDKGFHNSLEEQKNNVVFKSEKVKKMVEAGAQTAFDIWYEWDKEIYKNEPTFTKILNYVKNTNLNIKS